MLDMSLCSIAMMAQSQSQSAPQVAAIPVWWTILTSLGFGAIIGEAARMLLAWIGARRQSRLTLATVLAARMDPLLKSAEELVSRINSLVKDDFADLLSKNAQPGTLLKDVDRLSFYYVLLHFWASLELLRRDTVSVDMSRDAKGKRLLAFVRAFESKAIRLLDRHRQRLLAEYLIDDDKDGGACIHFRVFIERTKQDANLASLLSLLEPPGGRFTQRQWRQEVLRYGIVTIAFCDHFDSSHYATRRHQIHLDKLSPNSRELMQYAVMDRLLPFVDDRSRYYGLK